jgi:hypothetical protein
MYKVSYKMKTIDTVFMFKWFKTKQEADLFASGLGNRLIGVTKG